MRLFEIIVVPRETFLFIEAKYDPTLRIALNKMGTRLFSVRVQFVSINTWRLYL